LRRASGERLCRAGQVVVAPVVGDLHRGAAQLFQLAAQVPECGRGWGRSSQGSGVSGHRGPLNAGTAPKYSAPWGSGGGAANFHLKSCWRIALPPALSNEIICL
jgi:hypothetical protein